MTEDKEDVAPIGPENLTMKCECGCKHYYVWNTKEVECVDCGNTWGFEEID